MLTNHVSNQWLFLVPLIGGRYHIISQLALYKGWRFNLGIFSASVLGIFSAFLLVAVPAAAAGAGVVVVVVVLLVVVVVAVVAEVVVALVAGAAGGAAAAVAVAVAAAGVVVVVVVVVVGYPKLERKRRKIHIFGLPEVPLSKQQ